MLCPRRDLLNPGAAPAVLAQPRHQNPSAQRFVLRPIADIGLRDGSARKVPVSNRPFWPSRMIVVFPIAVPQSLLSASAPRRQFHDFQLCLLGRGQQCFQIVVMRIGGPRLTEYLQPESTGRPIWQAFRADECYSVILHDVLAFGGRNLPNIGSFAVYRRFPSNSPVMDQVEVGVLVFQPDYWCLSCHPAWKNELR